MTFREIALLESLEKTRKAYQAALIDLRLAQDAARELTNADGVHQLSTARRLFSAATVEYQNALKSFTDFTLIEKNGREFEADGE